MSSLDQVVATIDGMYEDELATIAEVVKERLSDLRACDPYEYFIIRILNTTSITQYLSKPVGTSWRQFACMDTESSKLRIFASHPLAARIVSCLERDPRGARYIVGKRIKSAEKLRVGKRTIDAWDRLSLTVGAP